MCKHFFMIDIDVIQCLLDDLLDRISLMNSSSVMICSSSLFSSKSIENQFNPSIEILNRSIKQILVHELNTIVRNGSMTNTGTIRHSRYSNPTTMIKQTNDLRKRLEWIEKRQMIMKYLNNTETEEISSETTSNLGSFENVWFDHRLNMLDKSVEFVEKQERKDEFETNSTCARGQIYHRNILHEKSFSRKLQRNQQIHREVNDFNVQSSSEMNLIISISKVADQIGQNTNEHLSNSLKKVSSSPLTVNRKKSTSNMQLPSSTMLPNKLQSSSAISITGGETNRFSKRTFEESRQFSNSQFTFNNNENNPKRQKRIASPLSISSTSGQTGGFMISSSPHEIVTPTWRVLTNNDLEIANKMAKSSETDEIEDISDESYIRRHIRCEFEQETWLSNVSQTTNQMSLSSTRKSGTLQSSLSAPNGLATTNPKQYRYRVTHSGIAYTETIDTK